MVDSLVDSEVDSVTSEVIIRLKSRYLNEQSIRHSYRIVKKEPKFEELFHGMSIDLQSTVIRLVSTPTPPSRLQTIIPIIRFMHRNGYDSGILSKWVYTDQNHNPVLYDGPGGQPSAALVLKIQEFTTALRQRDYRVGRQDNYDLAPVFFFLMRTVHGEEQIMEMIDYWMENIRYFWYASFEKMADSWDSLKHYPFAWSIRVL